MKVLLTQALPSLVDQPPNLPDLAFGYLSSLLARNGHDVCILDWNMDPRMEAYREALARIAPDVVGVKFFTKDAAAAAATMRAIREEAPNAVIVVGGPHASCCPPCELFAAFPECDFLMAGEAELGLPALLSALPNRTDRRAPAPAFAAIPGLAWRENGSVRANGTASVEFLDELDRPSWDLIPPSSYRGGMIASASSEGDSAPIMTTRGCPAHCSFCCVHLVSGYRIRRRSPENVIGEMRFLYDNHNVRKFMFMDNCFTSHRDGLKRLCNLIIESGMKIEWDCSSYERIDNLDDETLPLMRRSGCTYVHLGVESASGRVRENMGKGCSLEEYGRTVRLIRKHRISAGGWFMLGFPDEGLSDMMNTIAFAFTSGFNLICFTTCFPFPGTRVYDFLKGKHRVEKVDWTNFDIDRSPYPLSRLSSGQLTALLKFVRLLIRFHGLARRS